MKMSTHEVQDLKNEELDGAYPKACVVNTTRYRVHGEIKYAACSTDNFNLRAGAQESFARGLCLLTRINAVVQLEDRDVQAKPYTSTGTSYSQLAVIEVAPGVFEVTRRT